MALVSVRKGIEGECGREALKELVSLGRGRERLPLELELFLLETVEV